MTTENNGMYMPVAPAYGGNGGFGLGYDYRPDTSGYEYRPDPRQMPRW